MKQRRKREESNTNDKHSIHNNPDQKKHTHTLQPQPQASLVPWLSLAALFLLILFFLPFPSSLSSSFLFHFTAPRSPPLSSSTSLPLDQANYHHHSSPSSSREEDPFAFATSSKMITQEELSHRSAASASAAADTQLWLSLLGHVFDVTQGQTHYGPLGAYSFFTGRDASAAFITGQFTEEGLKEEADEVLTPQQLLELVEGWLQFYKDRYPLVGRLVGRFYTEQGKPTDALERVRQGLQAGRQLKQQEQAEREALPPCNRRWSQDEGAVVWCSKSSGGVRRDWEGVPRQYYGVASQADGKVTKKCVCVQERGENDPNLRVYPGCDPSASLCKVESKS